MGKADFHCNHGRVHDGHSFRFSGKAQSPGGKRTFAILWPNGHVGRSPVDSSVVEHAKTVPEATGSSRAKDGLVRFLGYALALEWREQ